MSRLSLFNHEKRISAIERALENRIWVWTAIVWLGCAVLILAYCIVKGEFP
jgi:hypothetical protein